MMRWEKKGKQNKPCVLEMLLVSQKLRKYFLPTYWSTIFRPPKQQQQKQRHGGKQLNNKLGKEKKQQKFLLIQLPRYYSKRLFRKPSWEERHKNTDHFFM